MSSDMATRMNAGILAQNVDYGCITVCKTNENPSGESKDEAKYATFVGSWSCTYEEALFCRQGQLLFLANPADRLLDFII